MTVATRVLSSRARDFARRYMELTEALQQQGVPLKLAREEARLAATLILLMPEYSNPDDPCPTCGRDR